MAACRSSLENTRKMNFIPVLNKTSLWAHTESELGVLGVPKKLAKYVVYSSKRKIEKKLFFFTEAAQTPIDQFLVSRNFRDSNYASCNLQSLIPKGPKSQIGFFEILGRLVPCQ
jgi:hypothetical protein